MKQSADIAKNIYARHRDQLTRGFSSDRVRAVDESFVRWIQFKLEQFDPDLYDEEEYINSIIPGEIAYQFEGLEPEQRFEKTVTAYEQLRVRQLSEVTYERARLFISKEGEPDQQRQQAEADLKELKAIENRLSTEYPNVYSQLKRQISESKLDCLYIIRDGGAASLRLGREIQRLLND